MSEDKYEEIKLIFNLESQEENVIKCHINEKLINMFDLYCQIKNLKIDSVFLLYNGIVIENYNVTLDKLLNSASKSVGEAKIVVIEKSKSLISNNSKMNDSCNDKKNINSNNIIYNMNNNSNNFPHSNNNNINQNQKNNIDNNMPPKKVGEIGLKSPGNEPLRSTNNNANNKPNFICIKCKNPINNANIPLCKNCFKNEIITECYFSYLSVLNQPKRPEEAIFANLNLINIKNEKINLNLDNALIRYNNLFPGLNFDRNSIVLELKKKICIYCTNEVKNNVFIELPCKCRICSVEHLNNYFTFYKDYLKPFTCRCKTTYNANMMFELALIKQLNKNNFIIIKNYFQKKLNSCCCICAKSTNIIGRSNQIVCLENPENYNFLRQIVHLFCDNCCRKYQNSEFTCHICHMKHFWNSN